MEDDGFVMPRRISMNESMIATVEQRRERYRKRKEAGDDGWKEVNLDGGDLPMTFEPRVCDSEDVEAKLSLSRGERAGSIFFRFISPKFMLRWLAEVENDYPDAFVRKRGRKRKATTFNYTVSGMFQALAMAIVIQGKQEKPTENQRDPNALNHAFQAARKELLDSLNGESLISADRARKLFSLLCLKVGTWHEIELEANFQSVVITLGEILVCDEKVWDHDNPNSGMIRVVASKKQVGLWNYTAVVWIPGKLTFLVCVRCHVELKILGECVPTWEVLNDWINVIKAKGLTFVTRAIAIMDSYYLSQPGLNDLRENGIPFVAAIQKDRFALMYSVIEGRVQKTGDYAFAIREKEDQPTELLTEFSSRDNRIKRRLTLTNALEKKNSKRRKFHIPGFYEYEKFFNGCDIYNRQMHDKSWPHKHVGGYYSSEYRAGSDYLFTCVLMNTFHCWKSVNFKRFGNASFLEFTQILAKDIISKYHK